MTTVKELLQQKGLAALARNKCFKFTDTFFPYTSGEIGPYYVNSEDITANATDYKEAIHSIATLVPRLDGLVISGGESRDWVFSYPAATELHAPHFTMYKDGNKAFGAKVAGANVVHVADLNNEGSSPRDFWIPFLRHAGANVKDIVFYVDRMEKGVGVMGNLGLNRHAVVELDSAAWDYLKANGVVSDEVYRNLQARSENPDGWAKNMLLSDAGIRQLLALRMHDNAKFQKIIDKGYKDMRAEILTRLEEQEALSRQQ